MNVGVYTSKVGIGSGGGYTFQAEILSSLAEQAQASQHTFFLMANSSEGLENYLQSGQIKLEILPSPAPNVKPHVPFYKRRLQKLIRSLSVSPSETQKNIKNLPNYSRAIEQSAHSRGIELIWFLGPPFETIPDIPFFATLWDLQHRLQAFFPEVSAGGAWEFRETFYSQYLRRAAIVITGTKTGQAEIERFYQVPEERIKVLPYPTPQFALDSFNSATHEILEKYNLQGEYLFYPAQFWAHKNHANLLKALQLLRDEHDFRIPLVLVGSDQGNEAYIRKVVTDLGLSSQVNILGFVDRAELIALYKNAFALAYMTLFGPDNLPPLEAFALGCPVLASDISGAREQLGNAALFVNPTNPQEIAEAILKLHHDAQLRSTLKERGIQRARQWTNKDFLNGIFGILNEFENIRRCWGSL